MRNPHALPIAGSFLSKIGWLALVLAIIGGLLGMHVIGGVHTLEPAPLADMGVTVTSDTHTATPIRHGFLNALQTDHPVAAIVTPAHQSEPMSYGGSPSESHASIDGHDTCVPSFGPDILVVPLPGIITWAHPGTAFTKTPGPKSKGRVPDPPSLIQLSIIRT